MKGQEKKMMEKRMTTLNEARRWRGSDLFVLIKSLVLHRYKAFPLLRGLRLLFERLS